MPPRILPEATHSSTQYHVSNIVSSWPNFGKLKVCKTLVIAVLISKLNGYALNHFSHEEDLMRAYAYPDWGYHARQHAYFVSQISKLESAKSNNAEKSWKKCSPSGGTGS